MNTLSIPSHVSYIWVLIIGLVMMMSGVTWGGDLPPIDLRVPLVNPNDGYGDRLPEQASIAQIIDTRLFEERFACVSTTPGAAIPSAEDNLHLSRAIHLYSQSQDRFNVAPFLKFLELHPESPWSASVWLNLGLQYRRQGYFSRALDCWASAWTLSKSTTDATQQLVANRAAAELMAMYAWVGRKDELAALFEELGPRFVTGITAQKIESARIGLLSMKTDVNHSFKCGPYAVANVNNAIKKSFEIPQKIIDATCTTNGTTLKEVKDLSTSLGLELVAVRKNVGVAVPFPSVVHWKLNHYSAIVGKDQFGRYQITDDTMDIYYGKETVIIQAVIDEESSGVYLAPASYAHQAGFTAVSDEEASLIFGRGNVGPPNDPLALSDGDNMVGGGNPCGMPSYSFHTMMVSLALRDVPLWYSPTQGPAVSFGLAYNEKDSLFPSDGSVPYCGAGWSPSVVSFIQLVDRFDQEHGFTTREGWYIATGSTHYYKFLCYLPNGGGFYFNATDEYHYNYSVDPLPPYVPGEYKEAYTGAIIKTSHVSNQWSFYHSDTYKIQLPNGMIYTYYVPHDSASNQAGPKLQSRYPVSTITSSEKYVTTFENVLPNNGDWYRLNAVVDPSGQRMTFDASDPLYPNRIKSVSDPFGRSVVMTYKIGASKLLDTITDMGGLTSSFGYETGTARINSFTTPYGTTTFARGAVNSTQFWIEATDPLGDKQHLEYVGYLPSFLDSDPANEFPDTTGLNPVLINRYLNYRNSFYWDKKAMRLAPGDYNKASVYHWLHRETLIEPPSRSLESKKELGSARVWYRYPGQTNTLNDVGITVRKPSKILQKIDDGTTKVYSLSYSDSQEIRGINDPIGRDTGISMSNGQLLNIAQAVRVNTTASTTLVNLLSIDYGTNSLPSTITDASLQKTTLGYDNQKHLTTIQMPRRAGMSTDEFMYFDYDASGRLQTIRDVKGTIATLENDGKNRVTKRTDVRNGGYVAYEYDNFDRITKISYPDGTYEKINWNKLDPEFYRDRKGGITEFRYNAVRQILWARQPNGVTTSFDWCKCGKISKITDSLGHTTTWKYNIAGQLLAKIYPDNKSEAYEYEPLSGRLHSRTDTKGQTTTYTYTIDDRVQNIAYSNSTVPTAPVSFAYDAFFPRLSSFTDETGTTQFSYNPIPFPNEAAVTGAGMLASITGPLAGSAVSMTYDTWGRAIGSSVGTTAASLSYDDLGRVGSMTNALGTFTPTYDLLSDRLMQITSPNSVKTTFAYAASPADRLMKSITNKTSKGTLISAQSYSFNPAGDITSWTQQASGLATVAWTYDQDESGQLLSAVKHASTTTGSLLTALSYVYDGAGNRQSQAITTPTQTSVGGASFNAVNQIQSGTAGGPMRLVGHLDEPGSVTVDGQPAQLGSGNTFSTEVNTVVGTNQFTVEATDANGNKRTNRIQVNTTDPANAKQYAFDDNGNCTSDGVSTYTWDACDRLVKIVKGTLQTDIVYDGMSRRVRMTERNNGTITSDVRYVWAGSQIAEERAANGTTINKKFYPQGFILNSVVSGKVVSTKYFYTRDHLGSVREVLSSTGTLVARYDYSPYGERTRVSGTYNADVGYTGHFQHAPSGLILSWFRAYDASSGRWLNRDPLGESEGTNLYRYVNNDPVNYIDPLGLGIFDQIEAKNQQLDELYEANGGCGGQGGGFGAGRAMVIGAAVGVAFMVAENMVPFGRLTKLLPKFSFGSDAKLLDHFKRHGSDFGHASPASYHAAADRFLTGNGGAGVLEKFRPNGDMIRYNPATNEFGVLSKDGVLRTYYKPDPAVHGYLTNLDYFYGQ